MTALKLSVPTVLYAFVAYALMLPFSFLLAAIIWAYKVSGVLYLCTDSLGIFDFVPPFVHPQGGDVYYVPAWRVYLIWYLLVAAALLAPALIIGVLWFMWRKEEKYDA